MNLRTISLVVIASWVAPGAFGQQAADNNRNYVINGQGGFQQGVINSSVVTCNPCSPMSNEYGTSVAGAPILWATSAQIQVGSLTSPTNSIDLDLASIAYLVDGTNAASPLASFYRTDALGNYNLTVPVPQVLRGTTRAFQMAHFSASAPDGFWVSQAHETTFQPNILGPEQYTSIPSTATTVNLADDGSALVPLGMSFDYYTYTQTEVYINANGNLTFGLGSSATSALFPTTNGLARISALFTDLDPSAGGTIAYETTSGLGIGTTFKVWYEGVPRYNDPRPNTFSVSLTRSGAIVVGGSPTGTITIDYQDLAEDTAVVGVNGDGQAALISFARSDLSAGTTIPTSNDRVGWESFSAQNPLDIQGHRIVVNLNTIGVPLTSN